MKYVVTDPCYLVSKSIWKESCNKCDTISTEENWSNNFDTIVEEALTNLTGSKAYVSSTGFGDWDNQLFGPNVEGTGSFTADAGMVCVCKLTDEILKNIEDTKLPEECYTVFEADGDIKVNFDKSDSDWTVVEIEDSADNYWNTHVPADEDED